jgi:hypothetical protein
MKTLIISGTFAIGYALKLGLSEYCEELTAGKSNFDIFEQAHLINSPEYINSGIKITLNYG